MVALLSFARDLAEGQSTDVINVCFIIGLMFSVLSTLIMVLPYGIKSIVSHVSVPLHLGQNTIQMVCFSPTQARIRMAYPFFGCVPLAVSEFRC